MISNVLVPLDGTLLAEQALPTAMSVVRRRHGRLELVLVRHRTQAGGFEDWPWAISTPETGDQYVTEKAREWSAALGDVVGHVSVDGDVAGEICRRAAEINADLIVMSTHGRTGVARMLAGSIADAVIRRSRAPVLLLRPPPPGRRIHRTPLHFRTILIPVDESDIARQVFEPVSLLAERGATELHLLRVVTPVRVEPGGMLSIGYVAGRMDSAATNTLVEEAERELAGLAAGLAESSGCDVFPHVIIDDRPGRAIVSFARRFNISLVAMTTHGRGASRLLLGSVTDSVLRDGDTPLLVLRPSVETGRH